MFLELLKVRFHCLIENGKYSFLTETFYLDSVIILLLLFRCKFYFCQARETIVSSLIIIILIINLFV